MVLVIFMRGKFPSVRSGVRGPLEESVARIRIGCLPMRRFVRPQVARPLISHFSRGIADRPATMRGGVNVTFLDGHQRFISNSLDLKVWRAAGTRNGNEVAGELP